MYGNSIRELTRNIVGTNINENRTGLDPVALHVLSFTDCRNNDIRLLYLFEKGVSWGGTHSPRKLVLLRFQEGFEFGCDIELP